MKRVAVLIVPILGLALAGCSGIQPKPGAGNLSLVNDREDVWNCTYLGEAIGVSGSWWYYWAIGNRELTVWARNDLRNRAFDMGGNRVLIQRNENSYDTSIVFIGQVYRCAEGAPSQMTGGERK